MSESKEFTIVMVGSGGVGKTSLTVQLTEGKFDEEYNPTIEDTYQKLLNINNERILLNILDTAGQEEYAVIRDQYWRAGDGFLIVFDVTNKQSFLDVQTYYNNIVKTKEVNDYPIVLCGNKCDLSKRQVSEEEARKLCEKNDWAYFETSAKTRFNVVESYETLCRIIMEYNLDDKTSSSTSSTQKKEKKRGFFSKIFSKKK
ncbi:hypothetical protein ABK040_010333 [Willaertia magna]